MNQRFVRRSRSVFVLHAAMVNLMTQRRWSTSFLSWQTDDVFERSDRRQQCVLFISFLFFLRWWFVFRLSGRGRTNGLHCHRLHALSALRRASFSGRPAVQKKWPTARLWLKDKCSG